jgi:hypothetical protein
VVIVTIVFNDIIIQQYHHGTRTVMIRSAISSIVYIMLCIINYMIYKRSIESYTLLNYYTVAVYFNVLYILLTLLYVKYVGIN